MTMEDRLDGWRRSGIIDDAQFGTLLALVRNERFSLFIELNGLLYLGVLSLVGGIGWTLSTHFAKLSDIFILAALSTLLAASVYYCFSRAPAYTNVETESPNFVFDYVVYFACLLLSVELGYVEYRFQWLKDAWDNYLLFSSIAFFFFAYRFDNRFVLSLALSSLAGFFGVQVSRFRPMTSAPLRMSAIVYAFLVIVVGVFMYRHSIKKHFLQTFLHVAAYVGFIALLSGLSEDTDKSFLAALLVVSAASVTMGLRFRRFAFVVYGIGFGYVGVTIEVGRIAHIDMSAMLLYLITTGSAVVALVILLARRFGTPA